MVGGIIDTDVHPWIGGIEKVLPYLDANWRRRFESRAHLNFMAALPCRAPHFNASILKPEAIPPDGDLPGTDPAFVASDHLDAHGIDAAILLVIEGGFLETWSDPDEAAVAARALNDLMADQWLSVDDRFHMAMSVSPHDPQQAADEIRRFGATERVCGIWLPLTRRPLGDRAFHPIYQAAEELGLTLVIHPTGAEGDFIESPGYAGGNPGLRIERYCLLPELPWTNIVSLVFQGVFERFPKLKIVFTEYGFDWAPSLMWRMDNVWKTARSSAPWVKRSPSEVVQEHIRFGSQPALTIPNAPFTEHVLEAMHAERTLLYSSDYPHWDGEETPDSVFRTASDELRQRIFRDNAIDTYGERLVLRARVPA